MKIACGKKSQLSRFFICLSVFALCCAAAQGQPQQHRAPIGRPPPPMGAPHGPAPMPAPHGAPSSQLHGPPHGQPSAQSIRERWLAMPPDARQNFRRNAELWMQMTPEQRNLMRQRENMRRQIITREADTAVRDSGLQLSPQERAQFESVTSKNAEKSNKGCGSKSK